MGRVHLDPENRTRREVLLRPERTLQIPDRNRQAFDDEIRSRAKGDERAAGRHELLKTLDARLPDAAAILGADRERAEAIEDIARVLIGQHNRIKPLPQSAGPDVRVVDRRHGEFVLLEHPAGPAFVDVAAGPGRYKAIRGW